MKLVVFSDSHGGAIYIKKALDMHRNADAAIFLGDGISDFFAWRERYPEIAFIAVRGNCDAGFGDMYGARATEELTLDGKRIFICHGNTYGVKGGYGNLVHAARLRGADIVLFGHTHQRLERYISEGEGAEDADAAGCACGTKPLYLVNPGSIGGRGSEGEHSFGIVEIKGNGVLVSFGCVS